MDSVAIFLLSIAAIFVIGALGEIIFQRTNIPDVVWLIFAGILLGPITGLVTREQLKSISPYFAALTLVVVLFEGGSALRLAELRRAAPRSSVLALLTFSVSAVLIAAVSMFFAWVHWLPAEWTWTHGFMLGAILGGSSSIIIMPAMAQARVEPRLANLVNLESALTDAFCVVGTSALIDVMIKGTTGAAGPAVTLLKSFGIGTAIGLVAGLIWMLFLRLLHSSEHAYPVTLSALLVLYVVIDKAGGSAAMGILTVAVVLGNAPSLSKVIGLAHEVELDTDVRGFHRQMAFIIKSFFFVFIGAMLGPPWSLIVMGVLLGGFLFSARLPGVYLALIGSNLSRGEKRLAAVSMPRGMAAGVLATLPFSAGIPGTQDLPVAVFACVLTTILVFAVGFPLIRRGMAPAAPGADVPLPAGSARPTNVRTGRASTVLLDGPTAVDAAPPFADPHSPGGYQQSPQAPHDPRTLESPPATQPSAMAGRPPQASNGDRGGENSNQ